MKLTTVFPYSIITRFIGVLLLFCTHFEGNAQEPGTDFKDKFHRAKGLLYYEKFEEALPILLELEKIESKNANVSYLIGVCYVAMHQKNDEAAKKLEYARTYMTKAYHPSSYKERNAPIYVLYYLCVSYCYETKCDEAKIAFEEFKSQLNDDESSYIKDAKARIEDCFKLKEASSPSPMQSAQEIAKPKPINLDSLKRSIATRRVIYTTREPIYGVQVGAFSQHIPSPNFEGLKNVQSFIDKEGMIRYVVGSHAVKMQAELLKKMIIDAGYPDAFIINVNDVQKYSEELMHPKRTGKVIYSVQIGAFKTYNNEVSEEVIKKYFEIENIKEMREGEFTILTVGSLKDLPAAERMKSVLVENYGISDAFIIAFVNDKKIPLDEAKKYTEK